MVSLLIIQISLVTDFLMHLKYQYCSQQFAIILLLNSFLCLIAVSLCSAVPSARGSGIPELKTLFAGTEYYDFLTLPTLVAKYASVFCIKLSGFGIGFESAFTHIAAIVGHAALSTGPFSNMGRRQHYKKLALSVCCCVGIVVIFGAPIGGTVFSIELFSSHFQVSNLFKNFMASSVSYFFFVLLSRNLIIIRLEYNPVDHFQKDLLCFVAMGVFLGLVALLSLRFFVFYFSFLENSRCILLSNNY